MTGTLDIKAEIRARKKARKAGLLDPPAPPVIEPATVAVPDDTEPATTEATYTGRVWSCRICQTHHRSPHIPAGWLSINRWPPDRERLGPITNTFCSPTCARDYLDRVELNPNVTYPLKRKETA